MTNFRVAIMILAQAVGLTFLAWIFGFGIFFYQVSSAKTPGDYTHTDAIVVLTGGAERINTGLDLMQFGSAEKMLISGVYDKVTLPQLLSMWSGHLDDPENKIFLGHIAQNTEQNAAEAKQWSEQMYIHSIRLVTSAYHMPRAHMEFRNAMPNIEILEHPVQSFDILHSVIEYNKMILAWLRMTFGQQAVKV